MSPAEIEKLKALDRAPDGSCWYCKTVMRGHFDGCPVASLPRLLEERERLLEALKGPGCWSSAADIDCPVCQKAEDAIAFAEAPAGKEEK